MFRAFCGFLGPEYIDCYRTRGMALSHLNRYKDGIADVSTAIRLRKDDPKLLCERGYLEDKAGMKKDAIPDQPAHPLAGVYSEPAWRPRRSLVNL
jgi:hypothetical protein